MTNTKQTRNRTKEELKRYDLRIALLKFDNALEAIRKEVKR